MIGIYKITSPSGKMYIGQSVDIEKRFTMYKNLNCKAQLKLYSSFLKHGVKNHIFQIIEECETNQLNNRERYWQDFYSVLVNGLNLKLTNSDDKSGFFSKDIRLKISLATKGVKKSKEAIEKMRLKKIGIPAHNKGIKMSEAQRLKLSKIHSGSKRKPLSKETKLKISLSQKGIPRKKHSIETKIKMSEDRKGNTYNKGSRNLILLDMNTGVFYNSIRDFCKIWSEKEIVVYNMLKGIKKVNKYNNLKII